jgi:putative pyruvate formate lyase activating enzyme
MIDGAELERRAREAYELLGPRCTVCPRLCKVDRRDDVKGLCAIGRDAVVASYFPHFGEENCLRGSRGSGTIFFSGCNLRCVFCQNHDISWDVRGERATADRLATMMLELQASGCHNINWVTPEHVVPQILEALPLAVEAGLRLPTVYNTSAYDSHDSVRLMEGVVDIYMPDFKLWTSERARRYLKRADYPDVARENIKEMHRQAGDLVLDERGLAHRGLILRHLVMPGLLNETEAILHWVHDELGTVLRVRQGRQGRRVRGDRPRHPCGGVRTGACRRRGARTAPRHAQQRRRPRARRFAHASLSRQRHHDSAASELDAAVSGHGSERHRRERARRR